MSLVFLVISDSQHMGLSQGLKTLADVEQAHNFNLKSFTRPYH